MVHNGIHVSSVIIDGIVDLPKTRECMPNKPDSFFVKPDDVESTHANRDTAPLLNVNAAEI